MRLLISGDLHEGIDKPGSCRRKAVEDALEHAMRILEGYDAFTHTGDEVDGPLSAPTLDNFARENVQRILAPMQHKKFLNFPKGNHSVPNHNWKNYPTTWQHLVKIEETDEPIFFLDFNPAGQDALQVDFNMILEHQLPNRKYKRGHLLLLGHCLWDGVLEYFNSSVPTRENWFKREWIDDLNRAASMHGYQSATIILGHDHAPDDRILSGVRVFTIGSPTPLSYGDELPRRLLGFDTETGNMWTHALPMFLKQVRITDLDQLASAQDLIAQGYRVHVHIVSDNPADMERIASAIADIRRAGGEVKDTSKLMDEVPKEELIKELDIDILKSWAQFEQDPEVRDEGLLWLAEVAHVLD